MEFDPEFEKTKNQTMRTLGCSELGSEVLEIQA
jgi:hypothetical protein